MPGPDRIDDKLYLGDRDDGDNERALRLANITAIVRVLQHPYSFIHGITYFEVPVCDLPTTNIAQYLPDAIHFIYEQHQAGNNVLIHCNAGISRSATVATAYLMTIKNISFSRALDLIRRSRSLARPNEGFEE